MVHSVDCFGCIPVGIPVGINKAVGSKLITQVWEQADIATSH